MSNSEAKPSKNSITRSAAVMGVATFLSRIAGLLREQTFAYLFGAGIWTDAFNVAFRIPNLLRDLFAEGAMSAAFVPTFNGVLQKDGYQKAFKLTNLTFSALLLVVGTLTIIGIAASPLIVSAIAPEFVSNPEKFEITVTMTRIMFPFLIAISWAAIAMGILNSLGEFFIPAIAPAFLNFSMILAGWLICPLAVDFDMPAITGMAIGAMIGGIIQFLVQVPALYKHGFKFKWQLNLKDPGIRKIVKLIIPGTIGLAATQVNIAISTILATSQGDGAVSWLSYAFRVMQLPLGLFGVAVAQATLPVISRQAAENRHADMAETLNHSIRLTTFINLFACFAIMALAEPVIRILFQHGRFTVADTVATALALRAYSVGLLFFCLVKVMGPAFYALDDTRVPVAASITAVVVNIILNLALIKSCGYWGLALGTGIAAIFNAGILFFMLSKKLGSFSQFGLGKSVAKIVLGTGISAAFMFSVNHFATNQFAAFWPERAGGVLATLLSLIIALAAGTIMLFVVSHLLKLEEAGQAKALIARKFFRKKAENPLKN
ncbi:MAG: putative peptidoglycan lipid flippase [Clostridiales bacterium]|nr:putative peptidoglycan lipid flippase [Clostridiales bacterium]MDN5282274.1 putative peptidoglycan lipid flippase [Candidatus Ozemobacter sp.]